MSTVPPPPPPGVPAPPGAPPPTPPGTEGASPLGPPAPFWKISRLIIPDADASATSQAAAYVVAVYAVGMVAFVADQVAMGIVVSLILLGGVLVGTATGASGWFRHAPGIILGMLASLATLIVLAVLGSVTGGFAGGDGRVLAVVVLGVGFFVAGLDWTRVGRLRAVPPLAALPVLVVSLDSDGPMLVVSLAWLALAVAALWSLECDQRAAFSDPRPLDPQRDGGTPVDSRDLAGALGLALLLGLLFAFSASMPSCSANLPGLGGLDLGGRDTGGRTLPLDGGILNIDDLRFGDFPFDFSGDLPSVDIGGVEHFLREGASGMLFLENSLTGERFPLRMEDGNLVARDAEGNVVAVIRPAEEEPESSSPPWKTILAVVAVVAVAGLGLWWYLKRRRPPAPPGSRQWAEDLVARLDRFGRAHGLPRDRSETAVHHAATLTERVAPDPRLPEAARVIADALFDREQPTMERRLWAEQVVDEVVAAHPPPSRIDRLRRRTRSAPDGGTDTDEPGGPGTPETVGAPPTIERP